MAKNSDKKITALLAADDRGETTAEQHAAVVRYRAAMAVALLAMNED